jgi:hypothetical protein
LGLARLMRFGAALAALHDYNEAAASPSSSAHRVVFPNQSASASPQLGGGGALYKRATFSIDIASQGLVLITTNLVANCVPLELYYNE